MRSSLWIHKELRYFHNKWGNLIPCFYQRDRVYALPEDVLERISRVEGTSSCDSGRRLEQSNETLLVLKASVKNLLVVDEVP